MTRITVPVPSNEAGLRAGFFTVHMHRSDVVRKAYAAVLAGGDRDSAALRAEFIDVLLEGPFADVSDEIARDDNDRETARIAFKQAVQGLLIVYFGEAPR